MIGKARLLCALLLALLCVAAHFQGACCRGGGGRGGGGSRGGGSRGGKGRPIIIGAGAGALGARTAAGSHGHSAAGEPHGRGVWRVSGTAAALAAAALVWWL